MRVIRLKNAKQGRPYATDLVDTPDRDEAENLAARWWSSGGTLGVVILNGRDQVARSEKPYLVPTRIPLDSWPRKEGKPPPIRANAGAKVELHCLSEGVGPYYMHEKEEVASVDAASQLAATWWEKPEVVSVLVLIVNQHGGVMEDSRYVQPRLNLARVPKSWALPEGISREEDPPKVVEEEATAPNVGPIFDTPLPKPPEEKTEGGCRCCMKQVPVAADPHDDDQTPSGRIANLRCPLCGQVVGQDATQLYWKYQQWLSAEHAQLPKPWGGQ